MSDARAPSGAPDTIGRALRSERISRGWTHEEAAEHLGVHQTTYTRWESGSLKPGPKLLPRIARWLDMEVTEVRRLKHGIEPSVDLLALLDRVDRQDGRLENAEEALARMQRQLDLALEMLRGYAHRFGPPEFGSNAPQGD